MRATGQMLSEHRDRVYTAAVLAEGSDPNLLGNNPSTLVALRHARLGTVDLDRALHSPLPEVRKALAHNRALTRRMQEVLIRDPVEGVRQAAGTRLIWIP